MRRNPARFRVSSFHFLSVWQLSDSVETVAVVLSRSVMTVLRWEERLRKAGLQLKRLPATPEPRALTVLIPSEN